MPPSEPLSGCFFSPHEHMQSTTARPLGAQLVLAVALLSLLGLAHAFQPNARERLVRPVSTGSALFGSRAADPRGSLSGNCLRQTIQLRGGGGVPTPRKELANSIKGCTDEEGLLKLLAENGESFDFGHVGTAWARLAKMRGAAAKSAAEGDVNQRLQVLTRKVVQVMGEWSETVQVSNILHSMSTLHESGRLPADDELMGMLLDRALATAGDFIPHDAATLLWALATMGIKAGPGLLQAMQKRATATAAQFEPHDIANILWALAAMGITPEPGLLEPMQQRATATAGKLQQQDVANLLWALACFDISPSAESVQMVESLSVSTGKRLNVQGKGQLHQWLLFCDLHPEWRGQLPASMLKVKEQLGGAFQEAFVNASSSRSRLQDDVSKTVRRLFPELEVKEEHTDAKSGYSIDIRVAGAGKVWAVEVDGPSHFLQGGSGRAPSGSTLLKRRLLAQLDYTAVAVPYWEWNALEGKGDEELRRYLQDKMGIDQV